MKRRRLLLPAALVLVAALAVFLWPRGPKEPVYEGKRLTQWIEETGAKDGGSRDAAGRARMETARQAVRALGTNALPWLMHEFARPESKWHTAFNRWAAKHPSVRYRFPHQSLRIHYAAHGIYLLGSNAVPALPMLAGFLPDELRSPYTSYPMSGMGDAAVPSLLRALTSTDKLAVGAAAQGLGMMMPHNELAVTSVIALLKHPEDSVRSSAASILRFAHGREDLVAPALADALTDGSSFVQMQAAGSLIELGPKAKAAVPELQRLVKFSTGRYERTASNVLFHIAPAALPAPRPPP